MGSSTDWGLAISVFVAAIVEMVEALTIVLAMGMTRSWKSTLVGIGAALVALTGFTAVTGYALATWLPRSSLQLVIGILLLIFGLQWLRKAILRSSGRKALHDEALIYEKQAKAAAAAGNETRFGLDWFSFVISFKGVFLEGVEVVFIVITFGLNAHNMPVAILGAVAAVVVVLLAAVVVHAPLTKVPENTLKFGVGLLLATFGTFWAIEGLGSLTPDRASLEWIGSDFVLLPILAGWLLLSVVLVRVLRVPVASPKASAALVDARGEV
ncbi:COG4280 domain-containing protein [Arthrobacter sp. FW306-2-2C-D06B]|uniref:COG4280 domain-containing protein n=1 Tax=Arthrobacter sp. FW306-2-2C-D06B TaxID=2879618 RepID=UPI001F1675D9|nr:TMEM165/GDT1 family protein [Arthrobacter sp. FW306-2-2C-D06B]UKA57234.1 TMEM165/GDT1 family protein [Arthrobacter sp. FW306-2-2C-D06B]